MWVWGGWQKDTFQLELHNRSRVLKRLGHVSGEGVVLRKGRAACMVLSGDELLITELMFDGAYIALDVHQLVAVVSCFVPCDKSKEEGRLARELEKPLQLLMNTARRVAEVGRNGKGGGGS